MVYFSVSSYIDGERENITEGQKRMRLVENVGESGKSEIYLLLDILRALVYFIRKQVGCQ